MRAARRDECSIHHRSSQPHGIRVAPKQAVGSRSGLSHDGLSTGKRRLTMRRLAILIAVVIGGLCLAQLFAYEDAHAATVDKPYLTVAQASAHKAPTIAQAKAILLAQYAPRRTESVTYCRRLRRTVNCTLTLRWQGEGIIA